MPRSTSKYKLYLYLFFLIFLSSIFNFKFLENYQDKFVLKNININGVSIKEKQNIEEVILATSATVEGQTTAYYIEETLKNLKVKISKLAQGLPVGREIESLDDGTLFSAFRNRTQI